MIEMMGISELNGKLDVYKTVTHPGSLKILVILRKTPAGFSELMFESRLSPSVLSKLLKSLSSYNIIEKENNNYALTPKGDRILRILLEVLNELQDVEEG